MNTLLSLHQSILEPVLSNWLAFRDLCPLDTAVCNAGLRDYFLTMLSLCRVVDTLDYEYGNDDAYDWAYLRKVSLNRVCLSWKQMSTPSVSVKYLLSNKFLSHLEASVCPPLVELAKSLSPSIKKLIASPNSHISEIPALLDSIGPSLEHLQITGAHFIPPSLGPIISRTCPNLKFFSALNINLFQFLISHPIELMDNVPVLSLMKAPGRYRPSTVTLECVDSPRGIKCFKIGDFAYKVTKVFFSGGNDEEVPYLAPVLPCVKDLSISDCKWKIVVELVQHCKALSSLTLHLESDNEIRDFASLVPGLSGLRLLHFVHRSLLVTDSIVLALAEHCRLLEDIRIDHSRISHRALVKLVGNCPGLARMGMNQEWDVNLLMPRAVRLNALFITEIPGLYSFELEECGSCLVYDPLKSMPVKCFQRLVQNNPLLRRVRFESQKNLNDASLELLVQSCPLLQEIDITDCKKITTEGMYALSRCKELILFRYEACRKVNNLSLERLLCGMSNLRRLQLRSCSDLQSKELQWIAKYCPSIVEVDVDHGELIEDKDVILLAKKCSCLSRLSLQGCSKLTSAVLPTLFNKSRMRSIQLCDSGCDYSETKRLVISSGISEHCSVLW